MYTPYDDLDELDENSPKSYLWAEIQHLRGRVAQLEAQRAQIARTLTDIYSIKKSPFLFVRGNVDDELLDEICKVWQKIVPESYVIVLPSGVSVESLSDEELSQIGLKRGSAYALTDAELYDQQIIRHSG